MIANRELVYRLASWLYLLLKMALGRAASQKDYDFFDVTPMDLQSKEAILVEERGINGSIVRLEKPIKSLDPVENVCLSGTNHHLRRSFVRRARENVSYGATPDTAVQLWRGFIDNSEIPARFGREGLHFGGFIGGTINSWCLPSWIWTNAALIRMYCSLGEMQSATKLADILLGMQHESGGWIVRNDYSSDGARPILAPNDSAYIANNAFVELYLTTSDRVYLEAAEKCASWIVSTARPDGLVWTGWDLKTSRWRTDRTIVDTGFTACLFARLLEITGSSIYREFLERFVSSFIRSFYIQGKGFATCIDEAGRKKGGRFLRGQAWALEGLISANRVLKCTSLKPVIDDTVETILQTQLTNGGWPYNLSRPYLGEDCKGVPVLTKSLLDWYQISHDKKLMASAKDAMEWCMSHTQVSGEAAGGIFSFSMEGAIVHNFNTQTALVYSSAYAVQAHNALRNEDNSAH